MKDCVNRTLFTGLAVVVLGLLPGLLPGCATSRHDVAPASAGKISVCSKCYDTIRTVSDSQGRRFGPAVKRTIVTHTCEECKSEMTIYEANGVLKVRCPTCAPDGVDCDRCVPKAQGR